MPNSVYLLQVITKNDLEDSKRLTGDIVRAIQRWCKPGMHARRNIAFVIVSTESLEEIGERIFPELRRMQELGSVERFLMHLAPEIVVSDYGSVDPLMHWLREGRVEAWKRDKSYNVRRRERRQRRV